MRASRCRPGSPAGPSTAPAEPRPSETCATFPGAATAAQSAASASSLALTAWWSWQLASLNFKPAFDPGCRHGERPPAHPPANSWLEPRWHQQPDSIRTLSKQHIHTPPSTPATVQTAYPHTASHTSNFNIYQQNSLLGQTSHRGTSLSRGPPELSHSLSQFVYMSSSLLVMISFFFWSISIKQADGLCRAQDRKAIQWGIETIYRAPVMCKLRSLPQSPKDTKRPHPPQPQSVHPAVSSQNIQYPLPYRQTTDPLRPSSCDTPQFVPHTPLCKMAGHQIGTVQWWFMVALIGTLYMRRGMKGHHQQGEKLCLDRIFSHLIHWMEDLFWPNQRWI